MEVASTEVWGYGSVMKDASCHSGDTPLRRCLRRRCVYAAMSSEEQDASSIENWMSERVRMTRARSAEVIGEMF